MTDEYDPFEEQDASGVPEGLPCVELEFSTLRRFREEMAPYLNYDGFFARTDRPLPRGTTVEFKFCLPEEFALAQGTAVVAWNIEPEGNPDLVPGMALRFGQVGKQSRAVIDELVDFHIATGGDPFDVGLRSDRVGEFPTDSLGGAGGGATSTIDIPAPEARDLPSQPEPEPSSPPDDGVLPDWLADSAALAGSDDPETADSLDFDDPPDGRTSVPSEQDELDFSTDSTGDGFDIDLVFDGAEKKVAPRRPEGGSFQQMAMAPRAEDKSPRDLRLGLIVTAGMILVVVIVLSVMYWLKSRDVQVAEAPPQEATIAEPGVALIEDDADQPIEGGFSESGEASVGETSDESPSKAAAGIAAESASEEPGDFDEAVLPVETGAGGVPTESSVTEKPPEVMPDRVAAGPASQVVDVAVAARSDATTVVIRGNGAFDASSFKISRLENPLRLWVRIFRIETFYKPNEIDVGSPDVDRVRIGYHPEDSPPALYVVLDLAGEDVHLLDRSVQGDAIRLTVGRK